MAVGRAGVRLPPAPDSIASARAEVRRALARWGLQHLVDPATLLVSELATNAVLHARTDFEVRVERRGDAVRVTVLDGSARGAIRRRYGLDAGTGRGLGLVETMAGAWGTARVEGGWRKAVWFELPEAGLPEPDEGALYGEDWLALVDEL